MRPGPKNLLTDVPGIKVGNAEDHDIRSGVTVVLPEERAVCGVDVRGGAPGTRDTEGGDPSCLVDKVDAVVLSGGSAFGLDAAGGVMSWLAKRGRGYAIGPDALVPIIPSAILFDLLNGGDKNWGDEPPYRKLGMAACDHAGDHFALGDAGAGLGATAGFGPPDQINGGLGSASFVIEADGRPALIVAALAAVNPVGSVLMPDSDVFWSWPFEQGGEFGGRRPRSEQVNPVVDDHPGEVAGNTTLVVVATDAVLSKGEAKRVAIMAHDGIARAIRPVHTPYDGDTVFVLSTGGAKLADPVADLARIGTLAADCTARAIARGVYEAGDLGDIPGYRSRFLGT